MSKKLLVIPVILLLASLGFAKQYDVQEGPGIHPVPGPIPDEAFQQDEPPRQLGVGTDFWQYIDAEDTWFGNSYWQCIAPALEFTNDQYGNVRVTDIEYNFYYSQPSYYPLGGHIWQDDGTGTPMWEGTWYNCINSGKAHRDFLLFGFPIRRDFTYYVPSPSRWFGMGEKFFVGWQNLYWGWGNYSGWNWTSVYDGLSWYWNTGYWYQVINQPGAPYSGCNTFGVSLDFMRYDYDAAALSVDVPGDLMMVGETITPEGTVVNNGQLTVDFDVTMTIEGGYSSTLHTPSLAMGATFVCVFDDWTAPDECGEEVEIEICTDLPGDMEPANDCKSSTTLLYSYYEDFDPGVYPPHDGGFTVVTTGWEHGVPLQTSAHSPPHVWGTKLAANYANGADYKLDSWHYNVTGPASFWFHHWYSIESFWDGGNVKMSVDGGPFTIIYPQGGYPEDATYCNGQPAYNGSSGWTQARFSLEGSEPLNPNLAVGQQVQFRFDFCSDPSVPYPGWFLDDFYFICLEPVVPEPDLDIDDNDGSLAANTMELAGPRGAVLVGEFNVVNPEEDLGSMNCPNVDYYDGPSQTPLAVAFSFPTPLISVGGGHQFVPTSYSYADAETGEVSFTTLDLCESRRVLMQVGIPHPCTPNKVYEGMVDAAGTGAGMFGMPGKTDTDHFLLYVHVVPAGGGNIWSTGFWGTPATEGNFLEWHGLAFGQEGYNIYRSEAGSFIKLNPSLLTENSYLDGNVFGGVCSDYKLGLSFDGGREVLIGPISITRTMDPMTYALHQNFPNPTRNETQIRYAVAAETEVSLKVYNAVGQVVEELVNTAQKPGVYTVSWKPDVSSGVYFYRLTAGDFSQTRKLVVVR